MSKKTLKTHLDEIRKKSHETMRKNDHFGKISRSDAARKGREEYWRQWRLKNKKTS